MNDHQSGVTSSLWTEWGALTRFLESARLAFARERALWHSLELANRESVAIRTRTKGRSYKVSLKDHVAAVEDDVTLFAAVLIHSYAIAEAAARAHAMLDHRQLGGIEKWGRALLEVSGYDWSAVQDGEAGAVEVAVVRNAFTHGTRAIDKASAARLAKAKAPKRVVGEPVSLSYEEVVLYRSRLRSLLNAGGLGETVSATSSAPPP